jgi:hypothetical protein
MIRREKAIGRRGIEVVGDGAVFVMVVIIGVGFVVVVVLDGLSEIEAEVEVEVDEGEVEFDIIGFIIMIKTLPPLDECSDFSLFSRDDC